MSGRMAGPFSALQNAGANNYEIPMEWRFSEARRTAGRIKRQLDQTLAAKQNNCQDDVRDLVLEVKYYKMLSDLYEKNVNLMDSVVAYLNHEVANGRLLEEGETARFYGLLITWLNNMEREMRRVLQLPSSEFAEMFVNLCGSVQRFLNELGNSIAANPKACCAAVGGLGGAVLLHKYLAGVCVASKVLAKLGFIGCGGACTTVGWLSAFACGALGGVFLLLAVKAFCTAFGPAEDPELQAELSNSFVDVHNEVESLKQVLLNCSDDDVETELRRIAAFWDRFETFNPDVDENTCPICLEPPTQPVLFRGCVGRHFHCFKCRDRVLATHSGGGRCPMCRQPVPGSQ